MLRNENLISLTMKPNRKILAGLGLSHFDEKVIAFTSLITTIIQPETLIFYHVIEEESKGSASIENKKATIQQEVLQSFGRALPDNAIFLVESGDPQELLHKKSEEKEIDLIILGQKTTEKNRILTDSLINSSESSLFLVPENAVPKISNIVIGIDFSEESHQSLDTATIIASSTGAEIHCLNVYRVPSGYHTSGKTYEEYAEVMKNNAREAAEKFKKRYKYDIPLNFDYILDDDSDPSDKLNEFAQRTSADLICVGSRGLDSFAALFFDTTAEKILEMSSNIPMLIVKIKNKNRSFLDAIREL